MEIRKAENADIGGILRLLSQVLEIHAKIRPDIFVSGTTKYTESELKGIIADKNRPIYVASDGQNKILGYAFCVLRETAFSNTMYDKKSLFIDDLCVDSTVRGKGIGKELFSFVKEKAKAFGATEITLAVWEGNIKAREFYDKLGMKPRETIMEIKV